MALSRFVARIAAWLRAGYPAGVPDQDYLPLLAVLGRRLTPAEVEQVVTELAAHGVLPANRVDAAVAIAHITHELPRETDLARVRERLLDGGMPITESWRDLSWQDHDRPREPYSHPDEPEGRRVRRLRGRYRDEVAQLVAMLHTICLRDRAVIATATRSLLDTDLEQAERAIDIGRDVEAMSYECEQEALRLLALQFPVAAELREIVTALRVVANLRRMAALAAHIAELARRRHPAAAVPEAARPLIERLGAATVAIATSAAEVLESHDTGAAGALDAQDDTVDRLHEQLLATILATDRDQDIAIAVDATLLGRYYERFADNAVEAARHTLSAGDSTPSA
ncbi:DUF3349 domain-containing protein [Nocardia arizonensis]|uniref:DUF3349 domain-containing protein n=1 Tax=Nocardia arizonensis TaxID=1141647 RepID=UPI0006D0624B|nr:DUF3349 domain-containing protein [Nocardia arizonensis]